MPTLFFRHSREVLTEEQGVKLRLHILRHAVVVLTDGFGMPIGADFVRNVIRRTEA